MSRKLGPKIVYINIQCELWVRPSYAPLSVLWPYQFERISGRKLLPRRLGSDDPLGQVTTPLLHSFISKRPPSNTTLKAKKGLASPPIKSRETEWDFLALGQDCTNVLRSYLLLAKLVAATAWHAVLIENIPPKHLLQYIYGPSI